jgi:hypothetical protein
MNSMIKMYGKVLSVVIVMMALIMICAPVNAGTIGFTEGEVAAPGTELHELGTKAIEEGLGGISYFANGEGQVLKVQAEEMDNGDLRVTVKETMIPKGYVSKTQSQTLEAERILTDLETLTDKQPRVGEYAVLPHNEGMKAYEFGVMVEKESHQADDINK